MEWRKPFSINTCGKYDASSLFGTNITEKRIRARTSVFCSLEVFGSVYCSWHLTNLKRNLERNKRFAPPHFSVAHVKSLQAFLPYWKVSYIHTLAHWAGGLVSFSGWVLLEGGLGLRIRIRIWSCRKDCHLWSLKEEWFDWHWCDVLVWKHWCCLKCAVLGLV